MRSNNTSGSSDLLLIDRQTEAASFPQSDNEQVFSEAVHTSLFRHTLRSLPVSPLTFFRGLPAEAQSALVELIQERPRILGSVDSKNVTLIQNLMEMQRRENGLAFVGEFDLRAHRLANDDSSRKHIGCVIERLRTLSNSTQDAHGTCATESIATIVNRRSPAEYARIASDLLTLGRTDIGKLEVRVPDDMHLQDASMNRTELDAVVQAALKNATSQPGEFYSNKDDAFYRTVTDNYGNEYDIKTRDAGVVDEDAKKLLSALLSDTHIDCDKEFAAAFMPHLLPDTYVALKWAPEGEKHGYHAVVFEKEGADGRIYFRNSQIDKEDKEGEELEDPPRRVEDPESGLQSMLRQDFMSHLEGIVASEREIHWAIYNNPTLLIDAVSFEARGGKVISLAILNEAEKWSADASKVEHFTKQAPLKKLMELHESGVLWNGYSDIRLLAISAAKYALLKGDLDPDLQSRVSKYLAYESRWGFSDRASNGLSREQTKTLEKTFLNGVPGRDFDVDAAARYAGYNHYFALKLLQHRSQSVRNAVAESLGREDPRLYMTSAPSVAARLLKEHGPDAQIPRHDSSIRRFLQRWWWKNFGF